MTGYGSEYASWENYVLANKISSLLSFFKCLEAWLWFPHSSIKIWRTLKRLWNVFNKLYKLMEGKFVFAFLAIVSLLEQCAYLIYLFFKLGVINVFLIGILKHITYVGYYSMGWESTGVFNQLCFCEWFSFLWFDVMYLNHSNYDMNHLWYNCSLKCNCLMT